MYCGQLLLFLLPHPSIYQLALVVVALLAPAVAGVAVVVAAGLMVAVAINKLKMMLRRCFNGF